MQLGNQAALARENRSRSYLNNWQRTARCWTFTSCLQRFRGPRLRAIGELLIAMADGCDAIEIWLSNWRDAYG